MKKTSAIDELFEQLFGFKPNKPGTAYEMLSSAVFKLISPQSKVLHDERMRGKFSESLYQIDVSVNDEDSKKMGEAKDYTIYNKKVGREDLQKLGGDLNDLEVEGGIFFSATDYTKPARQYAEASAQINNKGIELYHLRPVIETDKDGYILGFEIEFNILFLDFNHGTCKPVLTEKAIQLINQELELSGKKEFSFKDKIENIFDKNGEVLISMEELTRRLSKNFSNSMKNLEISSIVSEGYVLIADKLHAIHGLEFNIPVKNYQSFLKVSIEDKIKFTLKDEAGNIDKWITNFELQRIKFLPNGEAIIHKDDMEVA